MHAAPGARVVCSVPQVDVSAKIENSLAFGPPSTAAPIPVSGTLPVLVSVKTCAGHVKSPHPRVPEVVHEAGARVAATIPVTPVPESATGEPLTGTLAVMVTVPAFAPVEVGENVTVIVQDAPAASTAPQVPPARANTAGGGAGEVVATATAMLLASAVPVLCRVSVSAWLVEPVVTLPKASGPPVTFRIAVPPAPTNSTAPASTAPLVLRAVP